MFLTGIGTALPPRRFTQAETWEQLRHCEAAQQLSPRSQALLRRVLQGNNGIHSRYLAIDSVAEGCTPDPNVLHQRFVRHAPELGTNAAQRALRAAETAVEEIDAVVVSTCTGYLCPGLSSYLIERLGLRPDVMALDLVGQGCGAALPNLRTGEALLAAGRGRKVLSVCVEICSAAYYLDDDPGVLISACLFGDGAGAAVLDQEPGRLGRSVAWIDAVSTIDPGARDLLRFEQKNGFLRNVLTPPVPELAAAKAELLFATMAERADLKQKEVAAWILHAGGRDVLAALQRRLCLSEADLGWSAAVLQEIGNVSSPFVFFVLEKALQGGARSGRWWLSSFGAGFSGHGALLEVGIRRTES